MPPLPSGYSKPYWMLSNSPSTKALRNDAGGWMVKWQIPSAAEEQTPLYSYALAGDDGEATDGGSDGAAIVEPSTGATVTSTCVSVVRVLKVTVSETCNDKYILLPSAYSPPSAAVRRACGSKRDENPAVLRIPVVAPASRSCELKGPKVADMAPPPPKAAGVSVTTASLTLEATSMFTDAEPSACTLNDSA